MWARLMHPGRLAEQTAAQSQGHWQTQPRPECPLLLGPHALAAHMVAKRLLCPQPQAARTAAKSQGHWQMQPCPDCSLQVRLLHSGWRPAQAVAQGQGGQAAHRPALLLLPARQSGLPLPASLPFRGWSWSPACWHEPVLPGTLEALLLMWLLLASSEAAPESAQVGSAEPCSRPAQRSLAALPAPGPAQTQRIIGRCCRQELAGVAGKKGNT